MRPDSMQRYLTRILQSAGLPYVTWKDLRHTFATELTAQGISLRVVQELLGHTTIKMTARYAHVAPSTMREAVMKLVPKRQTKELNCHLMATRPLRGALWATSTAPVIVENVPHLRQKLTHQVSLLPGSAKGNRTALERERGRRADAL
jgi:hypothetical protein